MDARAPQADRMDVEQLRVYEVNDETDANDRHREFRGFRNGAFLRI